MKQYILAFLLLLIPIQSQAKLTYNKQEVIWEANRHKKEAHRHLCFAEDICPYIPDLKSKEHMKALITSTIGAVLVEDPRKKLLTVGLGLIGSLATDIYEQYYTDLRMHLYTAAYHLEMANFYNQMSLHVKGYEDMDKGTQHFFSAIDSLTLCEMITNCIADRWTKLEISNILIEKRNELLRQFNREGKLSYAVYEDALTFYENIGEIAAEAQDEDCLLEDICMAVGAAVESLAASLRFFEGYNCWPDLEEFGLFKFHVKCWQP